MPRSSAEPSHRVLPAVIALALTGVALACGPHFPHSILAEGDHAFLAAPTADFAFEVRRIAVSPDLAGFPCSETSTTEADRRDLRRALSRQGAPSAERIRLVEGLDRFRADVERFQEAVRAWKWRRRAEPYPVPEGLAVPAGLPEEFDLYLRGAAAHHRGRSEEAEKHWEALLALPPGERRFRSTWAAYMLGRASVEADPETAVRRFPRVRTMAREGYPDPLGLAAASLGWEARAELDLGHHGRATELYRAQDDVASLLATAKDLVFAADPDLVAAARDVRSRRLVSAYVLSHGGPRGSRPRPASPELISRWLDAVEQAQVDCVEDADRLAWIAYEAGDAAAAARWIARCDAEGPVALWVGAKLALRAGRMEEGVSLLARAAGHFPAAGRRWGLGGMGPTARVLAERGALHLARGEYARSLEALLDAGSWIDAAYVAERVLTLEELVTFVERYASAEACDGRDADDPRVRLRRLTGRRMVRAGRYDEARTHLPELLGPLLDTLAVSLAEGRDRRAGRATRAERLSDAARITRHRGMELMGSEVEPDWAIWNGAYAPSGTRTARALQEEGALLAPTLDETRRAAAHVPDPDVRYHYIRRALSLAWSAAVLMEDDTEQLAAWLCEAGGWIKARDPVAAEPFYEALVTRCPNTERGREAARLRWFPR